MTNYYNYKTYYLGTPKGIEEADTLILLNSSNFGNISLETLEDISEEIKKKEKLIKRAFKENDGGFKLELKGSIFDFDIILYHNQTLGYTGFTRFSNLQNCYSSSKIPFGVLRISLTFEKIQGEGSEYFIKILNSFEPNVENKKIFGDSNRWEYQESRAIFEKDQEENYLGFTNRIPDYLSDTNLCVITDSGVISNKLGISGLNILSGVDIDSEFYSTIGLVLCNEDISILKFNFQTGEYCVSSLSSLNMFGRPHDHLSGVIPYKEFDVTVDRLIDYNGQVILLSAGEDYLIYPLDNSSDNEPLLYPKKVDGRNMKNYIILDHLDFSKNIKYISDEDLRKEVSRSCLVPSDFKSNFYTYQSKFGKWWKFGISGKYLYTSVYGYILSDLEISFINSRLGMYQDSKKGIYHFFPIEFGHNYEIKSNQRVLDKTFKSYCDIVINSSESLSSLSPDIRYFLDGIRKKPINVPGCFPEENIIATGLGMIFYISDNLMYCY